MAYCPKCQAEYKDGRDECIDCGVPLVEAMDELEETEDSGGFVPLRTLPSRMYAQMLKESLEKAGIPALIKGEDIGIMLGNFGTTSTVPVELWVPADEVDKAETIAAGMMGEK
jgi:hypothetical protein